MYPEAGCMTIAMEDKFISCNYIQPAKVAAEGALCFVLNPNPGNGAANVELLIRSRGGRLICKWERIHRLGRFRLKTVVSEDARLWSKLDTLALLRLSTHGDLSDWIEGLNKAAEAERGKRGARVSGVS